jgi:hypothetical protein
MSGFPHKGKQRNLSRRIKILFIKNQIQLWKENFTWNADRGFAGTVVTHLVYALVWIEGRTMDD